MKKLAVAFTVTGVLLGSGLVFGEEPAELPKEIQKETRVSGWSLEDGGQNR